MNKLLFNPLMAEAHRTEADKTEAHMGKFPLLLREDEIYRSIAPSPSRLTTTSISKSSTRICVKASTQFRVRKVFGLVIPIQAKKETPMLLSTRPEHLLRVRYVSPSSIKLQFVDKSFSLKIALLGMPVDRIRWETLAASTSGEVMTVKGIKGETIPIDSSTLRYLVDKKYAAKMDAVLKSLQFSRKELEEMAQRNAPPPELLSQGEQNLIMESWK